MTQGQIYKIHSDFYYVDDGKNIYECKIREVLKKQKEKVFVGDFVEFSNAVIEKILPRNNFIARPSVANIDQIVIVSAIKEPELNFHQLNRFIALARYYKIPVVLCFNKSDLDYSADFKKEVISIYEPLGYKMIFTSAKKHTGTNRLKKILNGKISVLCGNSGVGKSSLINEINPNVHLRTQEVSEKTQQGIHTTRHCEIIKIDDTSKIIDTPGFSNIKFNFILPNEIALLFNEFMEFSTKCKFKNCLHINEQGCSVLKNLKNIAKSRYESYLELVEEAKAFKEHIKYNGQKTETSKKVIHEKSVAKISAKKRQNARNTLKQNIYKGINEDETTFGTD